MRLQDHIDFTTLQWVKPELDETLSIAREALESYVEAPQDHAAMRSCAEHLHQARGTLQMVELHGAATVAAEMEVLANELLADRIADRQETYAVLMRGLMQLPDYLERLSGGHRDVPVVLLPLLNDLRASRGEPALSESALFHPNLDAFLPEQAPAALSDEQAQAYRSDMAALRLQFQQQLLGWFRGQDVPQRLRAMRKTLLAITARCYHVHGRRLWWIAAGVMEGLEQGVLKDADGDIRRSIARVDRHIRDLIEHGEGSLRGGDADEVACKLLYLVAHAPHSSPQMELLRQTYALAELVPQASELAHAQGSMAGHNRALLDSVSRALKDDLLRVKEALDLFLRQTDADPAQLAEQGEVLGRVGDTLGMLALAVPRRVVGEQRRVLDDLANRVRPADEETLLDVAGALLYVEASLDDHIERLGSAEADEELSTVADLPRAEALGVVSTLMGEAIANTDKVKEAIVAFVESGWQHDRLVGTPALMNEVSGAMQMLSSPRPADLALGVGRFIDYELLREHRVPSGTQMDHLADALAALEYYLEAARDHRGGLDHILDVAEHSLGQIGYWPLPAQRESLPDVEAAITRAQDQEVVAAPVELSEPVSLAPGDDLSALLVGGAEAVPAAGMDVDDLHLALTEPTAPLPVEADGADEDWEEIEEEVFEEMPARDALAADAGFNANAEGIDDDIREIFLEEMQEEIDNLHAAEAVWLADPTELSRLGGIRRSFHTLKGSGRLVGAGVLGEFAWKVENMLNRVLDSTIAPDTEVQALVHHAIAALPGLLLALKGEGTPEAPLSAIMRAAEQLAAGQSAQVEDYLPAGIEMVRRVIRRRVPRVHAESVPQAGLTDADARTAHAEQSFEPALALPVMPAVDPVLLEILRSEVAQYLQILRAAVDHGDAELPISEELLRSVHTLHGAIAMVDIPLLTQLLAPLEVLFKRLRAAGLPLPAPGVQLLGRTMDVVDQVMQQFDAAEPQLPTVDELAAALIDLRDRYPESQVAHVVFGPRPDETAPIDASEPTADTEARTEETTAAEADEDAASASDAGDDAHREVDAAVAAFLGNDLAADDELPPLAIDGGSDETVVDDVQHAAFADRLVSALTSFEPTVADAEGERAEAERAAAERAEAERVEAERADEERAQAERLEAQRVEAERAEAERADEERAQAERLEAERAEAERAEAQRVEAEQAAAERADRERAEAERLEAERVENERLEAERAENERLETERLAAAAAETQRLEAELAEAQRIEQQAAADAAAQAQAEREQAEEEAARAADEVQGQSAEPPEQETASVPMAPIDADLLEVFIDEARELLDHADDVLALWHAQPEETGHVAELRRDLHTLKGGARIAGLVPVGDLAHAVETLLEKRVRGKAQVGSLISTLESSFDQLNTLVQKIAHGETPAYPQAMIDQLLALAGETTFADDAMLAAAVTPEAKPAAPAAPVPAVPVPVLAHDLPELLPEEQSEPSSTQEQIRVRADLLDNLVSHAGEVAIYRSRLEQQVSGYRYNLVELEQTVARLRSQLRMLEIETEAQIIARFQREHREAGLAAFDPLELDRYSQLQQYSRALAESVSDLVSIQGTLDELTRQAETLLIQQSRVSTELQDGLLRTRMVPFDTMVPNLRRTLRQAAREQSKNAQLYVDGAHGEMDRNLLDRIKAPFEHMLRNAIAHGIETPAERRKAGKPAEGSVHIQVAREATEVVIRVSDDGRGLDRDAIRKRGIERGLLHPDIKPTDNQLLSLITQTGFSTAGKVTQLAGRGVGMDVVANEIKQLGGSLSIESEHGKGTTFILRLPFTLAVTQAIMVRIGEATFAIPMTSVQGVARVNPEDLVDLLAADEPSFRYGTEDFGIHDLAELLGLPPGVPPEGEQLPLLLTRAGDLRAAIRIDAVLGSREIVVKSVGPQISSVPGLLGATIMGDGSVLVILDLAPLVRHGITRRQLRLAEGLSAVPAPVVEEVLVRPLVMVVDDSITMRKVTGRVLERHEYEVSTAKDGVDALEKLHERVPDLMLLDIEMPRMDGYELATAMKADPRLRDVPIIMITSRSGDKHRQRALDIGVERYLGKPYQEADLLTQIAEVLDARALEPSHD
jgi:chemosensory pili system protein ChpA (sensor histidine kinase/response regulator)